MLKVNKFMYCNIIYFCIYERHSFSLKDYIHVFLVPGLLFLLPVSMKGFFSLWFAVSISCLQVQVNG